MGQLHTVQRGETLSSIARRHGCDVVALQTLNGIAEPRNLQVGAVLQLPDMRQRGLTQRPVSPALAPPNAVFAAEKLPPSPGTRADVSWQETAVAVADGLLTRSVRMAHGLSDAVLQWLRENESAQMVHAKHTAKTESRKPEEQRKSQQATASPKAATKKHKDEVLGRLRERLFATPHCVTTRGVKLSRNERKMIVAAVGLCEINNDVFGSRNLDYEFVGRKFKRRGIETSYSRIVHIGLSYGYIQFTQDSGSLGRMLSRMKAADPYEFARHFPNHEELMRLTTGGLPGAQRYGLSGQSYWNSMNKKSKRELKTRANTDADDDGYPDHPLTDQEEIRGARVQKIPYVNGAAPLDLWEDYAQRPMLQDGKVAEFHGYSSAFKAAGDVPMFQDVQLALAVEDYLNPMLPLCKAWNIRSSKGIAFVVACAIRGGPGSDLAKLLVRVAAAKLKLERFDKPEHEIECIATIADTVKGGGHAVREIAGVRFDADEGRRARLLLADEFGFLREDQYDIETYNDASDI